MTDRTNAPLHRKVVLKLSQTVGNLEIWQVRKSKNYRRWENIDADEQSEQYSDTRLSQLMG